MKRVANTNVEQLASITVDKKKVVVAILSNDEGEMTLYSIPFENFSENQLGNFMKYAGLNSSNDGWFDNVEARLYDVESIELKLCPGVLTYSSSKELLTFHASNVEIVDLMVAYG